jgi:hypothetical protein
MAGMAQVASMSAAASVIARMVRFIVLSFVKFGLPRSATQNLGESLWAQKDIASEGFMARNQEFVRSSGWILDFAPTGAGVAAQGVPRKRPSLPSWR